MKPDNVSPNITLESIIESGLGHGLPDSPGGHGFRASPPSTGRGGPGRAVRPPPAVRVGEEAGFRRHGDSADGSGFRRAQSSNPKAASRVHPLAGVFVNCALTGLGLAVTGLLWLALWQPAWLAYPGQPAKVTAPFLYPGDTVPIVLSRLNRDKVPHTFQVVRLLQCDSFKRPLVLGQSVQSIDPGEATVVRMGTVLPLTVPDDRTGAEYPMKADKCFIEWRSEIQGLIRTMTVVGRTESFRVLERP